MTNSDYISYNSYIENILVPTMEEVSQLAIAVRATARLKYLDPNEFIAYIESSIPAIVNAKDVFKVTDVQSHIHEMVNAYFSKRRVQHFMTTSTQLDTLCFKYITYKIKRDQRIGNIMNRVNKNTETNITDKDILTTQTLNKSKKTKSSEKTGCFFAIIISVISVFILLYYLNEDSNENYSSYSNNESKVQNRNTPKETVPVVKLERSEENIPVDESNSNKYYVDGKGNIRIVSNGKEYEFLSKYPGAREATEGELSAYESKKARDAESGKQAIGNPIEERSLNKDLSYIRPVNGSSPYNEYYGGSVMNKSSHGEITIVNGTSQDALVLIYDQKTNKVIRNIYIRSESQYKITYVPKGYFKMKTFYGNDWASNLDNGEKYPKGGFTRNVSFSEMASHERFDMNWQEDSSGINYPTYTVTLHKILDGNLETKSIDKKHFFE